MFGEANAALEVLPPLPRKGDFIQATITIGGFEKHSYTGDVERIRTTARGPWIDISTNQTFPARSGRGIKVEIMNFGRTRSN